MPQIANQDYNVIEIQDVSDLTNAEKGLLKRKYLEGTAFDSIIRDIASNSLIRILSISGTTLWVFSPGDGEIISLRLDS